MLEAQTLLKEEVDVNDGTGINGYGTWGGIKRNRRGELYRKLNQVRYAIRDETGWIGMKNRLWSLNTN